LYLGVDSGIKVDHQPVQFNESTQGGALFSKKTKIENTTRTTVIKNLKKNPVKVIVFDQKPFTSNTNDIKIKVEENKNFAMTLDEYSLVSWSLHLEPDQEGVVDFKYSIEYPVEKTIVANEQKDVKGEMRL